MNQFFFLFVILLLCCTATAASNDGKSREMNNQIATFNISALSAQVIAGVEEAKKIEDTTLQEDVVDTEAYRLFTLQRDSEMYIESLGEGGYTGSLLNFIAIDADTTCYFCIPRSEWPTTGWQKQEG